MVLWRQYATPRTPGGTVEIRQPVREGVVKSHSLQPAEGFGGRGGGVALWDVLVGHEGRGAHSGCGLEFQEKKPGSLKMESLRPGSGRVRVSGADFFLGRSFGTVRNSGASVESGVDGALLGPPRAQDGSGVSEMEMEGGKVPILRLVASCVARSYSLTSSIVMSAGMETYCCIFFF